MEKLFMTALSKMTGIIKPHDLRKSPGDVMMGLSRKEVKL